MTTVKLLLAEDEDAIRESIQKYISAHTKVISEIYAAENGGQALDMIMRYRPEIMLMDIQMPLKSGLEVMREAIAAGVCPKTVILSGHDQFSYAQQALRLGAVDYLLKPCRAAEILEKLETLAREVCSAAEASAPKQDEGGKRVHSIVEKALTFMKEHYPENLTLPLVAEKTGVSPNYLSALFGKNVNMGFTDKLNEIRIERACDYFAAGGMRTYEVAYKVGFNDEKYFSSVFKKLKGASPSEYKKQL
ncbi:MAG: response regulator [Clostridiales bacterium]|jgi:two-component system response regulator YesN|nr:response regulator [Clostridiales bacterium]